MEIACASIHYRDDRLFYGVCFIDQILKENGENISYVSNVFQLQNLNLYFSLFWPSLSFSSYFFLFFFFLIFFTPS